MEVKQFKAVLKKHGFSVTQPRLRLFKLLQHQPAVTMQKLISLLVSHDQATVYRSIDLFEKLGIVNRLRLGWQTKIELSDIFRHHHHHFTCIKCGRVFTLPDDPIIERRIARISQDKNFTMVDHQLEIRGHCPRCQIKT